MTDQKVSQLLLSIKNSWLFHLLGYCSPASVRSGHGHKIGERIMEEVNEVPLNSSNFLSDVHLARGTIVFSSPKNQQVSMLKPVCFVISLCFVVPSEEKME